MMLEDYPISKIKEAFKQYLRTSKDIPTPADIIGIIDPSTQPLSQAVYIRISNKDHADRSASDYEYLRAFERQEFKKLDAPQRPEKILTRPEDIAQPQGFGKSNYQIYLEKKRQQAA